MRPGEVKHVIIRMGILWFQLEATEWGPMLAILVTAASHSLTAQVRRDPKMVPASFTSDSIPKKIPRA